MKRLNTLVLGALISTNAMASIATDKNFDQQIRAQGLVAKDQSYCFTNAAGKTEGTNVDMRIRLASVSKLLTSLWAVDKLGMEYKYDMKITIKDNNLHIAGALDPFLGNEKMFYLVSQLNALGYTKFDTITFDKNLIIDPDVAYESDEYPSMSNAMIAKHLRNYFNTATWSADTKTEYATYRNMAAPGRFVKDISFEATNVKFVEENPFKDDADAKVLTLPSPALYKYLKEMNIKSNNTVAESVFRQLGGLPAFKEYMSSRYSLTTDQIQFFTGSGLPATVNGERKDNYATCAVMLDLLSNLKATVEKQGKELEDLVAVPGSDGGTFRNRTFGSEYKNSFVAKTGTLMHTSTLAGAMNTQKGFSFFGVFNQSTDIGGSKVVQNSMVKSIMTEMGGPKAFDYEVPGFHAYTDALKSFGDEEDTNFSTIESGLN
ncbi:MAG: D-alanyl-D-alanine carboxypeptidase [Rhizobacter sp.]|nr:D-alanyl-D-alanine carboxypeptidase [Bacteriovorax sp.]